MREPNEITDDQAIRLILDHVLTRSHYQNLRTFEGIKSQRGGAGGPLYLEDRGTLDYSEDPKPSHTWDINFFTPQYVEARLSESLTDGGKRHWEFKWTRKQFHSQVVKYLAATEEDES